MKLESFETFPPDSTSPLMDIAVEVYTTRYVNAKNQNDKQYENHDFTGVNITYKFNPDGKLQGVKSSIFFFLGGGLRESFKQTNKK